MVGEPSYLGVATGAWVAALKSSDPLERRLAAHALAEIGPAAREAVQQPEISVERRVFGRLGHHRTADLLEVHRCAQCLVGLVLKLLIR